MKRGILLINLGTPKGTDVADIKAYLGEFLMDKRVVNLPAFVRCLALSFFILPFRARKSARAYRSIWTDQGSPLLSHSQHLVKQLQKHLNKHFQGSAEYSVALGMRYGSPSIASALEQLKTCATLTILPLYPQYSSAASGSAIEQALVFLTALDVIPSFRVISHFYHYPKYIKAQAHIIGAHLQEQSHLLFSYHGLPEHQIQSTGCVHPCKGSCPSPSGPTQSCYKAQCHETSRLLAKELNLSPNQYTTVFQSRVGRTPWIKPYIHEELITLATRGIINITITCPSFVTDCLETLEEIGIRAKEQWLTLGGKQCTLVPSMNADPVWINALAELIEDEVEPMPLDQCRLGLGPT